MNHPQEELLQLLRTALQRGRNPVQGGGLQIDIPGGRGRAQRPVPAPPPMPAGGAPPRVLDTGAGGLLNPSPVPAPPVTREADPPLPVPGLVTDKGAVFIDNK